MEDFILLVDSSEIANCLSKRKTRKRDSLIMTDLFDPVFSHRETDQTSGKSYQVFKLRNIDKLGINYKVLQLPFGDYIFATINEDGRRVVQIWERKTANDMIGSFAGSIKVGNGKKSKIRLDEQLKEDWNMGEKYYGDVEVNLLIEDYYCVEFNFDEENWGIWIKTWEKHDEKKKDRKGLPYSKLTGRTRRAMRPNSFLEKIHALETRGIEVSPGVFKPVNVIKCGGAHHAYKTLTEKITGTGIKHATGVRATRRKPKNMSIPDNQIFFLEGLPGFGGGTAKNVLEKYPVPMDFLEKLVSVNDVKELGIPRFGKRQFEPSRNVLTRKHDEKND